MITVLLILAGAAILYADKLKAFLAAHSASLPKLTPQHWLGIGCLALAAVLYVSPQHQVDGGPVVVPDTSGPLNLRGLFIGPDAARDAAALAALCEELACAVEYDGELDKPRLSTGWAIADLRTIARDVRLKGETFGDLQPQVRDAVKAYLDRPEILGKSGGPLGPKDRARWISAFRDIARAAEAAVQ